MTLTAQQVADTRRWMGYSVSGDTTSQPYREAVYTDVAFAGLSIDYRLAHLAPEEEATLNTVFLPSLALREQEIQGVAANADTESAAVWKRNPRELAERRDLYRTLRFELCAYLGFPAGVALAAGGRMVRG